MRSRRDTGRCGHPKTLKKTQKIQDLPLGYERFTANQGKRAKRSHNHKCDPHGARKSVEPERPRSQSKSRGSQMVEQEWYATNEDFFQNIGNLPFARPEKNISGQFIQQGLIRKIGLTPKEANYVKDRCRNNGLISHNSKQVLTRSDKQIHKMKNERQDSSPFLEELDRYIDELDYGSDQYHKVYNCEDSSEEQKSHRMYRSIDDESQQTYRDVRYNKIIEKLREERKDKEMIADKIALRDKKIKKMNNTAFHMLEYIRELKGEVASIRQQKEEHLWALNEFIARYESIRKSTAQQQKTYQALRNDRRSDAGQVDQLRMRPIQERISSKLQATKLKKRGLGNRNMINERHFKGRGSNREQAIEFYEYP